MYVISNPRLAMSGPMPKKGEPKLNKYIPEGLTHFRGQRCPGKPALQISPSRCEAGSSDLNSPQDGNEGNGGKHATVGRSS